MPTIQLSTVAPLLAAMIAAALGYLFGRRLETRKQLTLQKGQAYADFPRALATAATSSRSNENLGLAADAKTRVCIYGAPKVIKHLAAFERSGARIEGPESRAVITALIKEMRRDMGVPRGVLSDTDLHDSLFGPSKA